MSWNENTADQMADNVVNKEAPLPTQLLLKKLFLAVGPEKVKNLLHEVQPYANGDGVSSALYIVNKLS